MAPFLLAIIAILNLRSAGALSNHSTPKGFTLELIHRDSIHSPLYPGNLTAVDRVRRRVDLSESRFRRLKLLIAGQYDGMTIRPEVECDNGLFFVKVGIGTPPTAQHLMIDTATDLSWVQCHPCNPCFEHHPPFYKPAASPSYKLTPCSHPLCAPYKCSRGKCRYEERYADKSFTRGTLAMEAFTFTSSHGGDATEAMWGLVFGCSTASSKRMFKGRKAIHGILGMDMESASFATQITSRIGDGRFSYCLPLIDLDHPQISFLQFGADIREGPHFAATPFVTSPHRPTCYYLKLNDISVDGERLNLPPGVFERKPDGSGGCIIDSGAEFTLLQVNAYRPVEAALAAYFGRFNNIKRVSGKKYGLDLCYRVRENFSDWPSMTLHFEGADLLLRPQSLFETIVGRNDTSCLSMLPKHDFTILGATSQQEIRFIFDIARQQLRFAPENCGRA